MQKVWSKLHHLSSCTIYSGISSLTKKNPNSFLCADQRSDDKEKKLFLELVWYFCKVSFLFDILISLLPFFTQLPLKHENNMSCTYLSFHSSLTIHQFRFNKGCLKNTVGVKQPLPKIQEDLCCFSFLILCIFTLNLVELGWPIHFIYSTFSTRTEKRQKLPDVSSGEWKGMCRLAHQGMAR